MKKIKNENINLIFFSTVFTPKILNDYKYIQAEKFQDQDQILGYLKFFSSSIDISFFFIYFILFYFILFYFILESFNF